MAAVLEPVRTRPDLARTEGDLLPDSLPGLRPSRFPEQAKAERELYLRLRKAWRELAVYLWPRLRMPGKLVTQAALPDYYELTPADLAELDRARHYWEQTVLGNFRDPEAFSQPSNAHIDVSTPIYDGTPILPSELRTSFALGMARALAATGAEEASLLGVRNEAAQQDMLQRAFERLSDQGHAKIGDVITREGIPGGSVRDVLNSAMSEGQNPLQTARVLREKFKDIEGYNWERLARTETSFAQNHAILAEYEAEGYRLPVGDDGPLETPPFHPQCVCSTSIDTETGRIILDVAATACEICQAALMEAALLG